MLNIQNVFFNPALLMTALGLTGMLISFATNARMCFKSKMAKSRKG